MYDSAILNGEALEEVDQFKYLDSVIAANGGVEADVHLKVYFGQTLLKVAKNFLHPEMPLSVFWERHTEEAKKVLGYLVAKHFPGLLCAHQNDTLDNLFLLVLTTTYFAVYRRRWPSLM